MPQREHRHNGQNTAESVHGSLYSVAARAIILAVSSTTSLRLDTFGDVIAGGQSAAGFSGGSTID